METVSRAQVRALALAAAGLVLAAAPAAAQSPPSDARCVQCHRQLADTNLSRPARLFPTDIHAKFGFGCLDCHGGETGKDSAAGFIAKPNRKDIPALCGRCHSDAQFMKQYDPSLRVDQVEEYKTSVHGKRLFEFGDTNVAVCISCHPAHEIRPPSDPESTVYALNVPATCGHCHADPKRMAPYHIPTDQLAQYKTSVHWEWMSKQGDLSAPACNDCHGNHGAAPPGVASVKNVCGQCHSTMMTLFTGSGHADYFVQRDLPGCETCHSNHAIHAPSDSFLVEMADSVCAMCHQPGDSARVAFLAIRHLIDSLRVARDSATAILDRAQQAGMEVSQAQFELADAKDALLKARSAIHSFSVDTVAAQLKSGFAITTHAEQRGAAAMHEHLFRREGLAVAVLLILGVIAGIWLLIREIEHRQKHSSRSS